MFEKAKQKWQTFLNTIGFGDTPEKLRASNPYSYEDRNFYNNVQNRMLNSNMKSPIPAENMVAQENQNRLRIKIPPKEAEVYAQQIQPQMQQQSNNVPEVSPDNYQRAYQDVISQVFGNMANDANQVLRYTDPNTGQIRGENTRYQTGPEVDIPNKDGSIDRGLFRINSNTFEDFMRRKKKLLANYGIDNYEDMYDPLKNSIMAKLIQEEQGWGAWYAAPENLRNK